jgi:hypothetical protein
MKLQARLFLFCSQQNYFSAGSPVTVSGGGTVLQDEEPVERRVGRIQLTLTTRSTYAQLIPGSFTEKTSTIFPYVNA